MGPLLKVHSGRSFISYPIFARHFSCNIGQRSHFTLFHWYLPWHHSSSNL